MDAFVDTVIKGCCWNLRESYGEICIHCNCCSKDAETRLKSRIAVLNDYIAEDEDDIKELNKTISNAKLQKKKALEDINSCKKQKRIYRNQLAEVRKNNV